MPEAEAGTLVLDCDELEELAGALALGAALPQEVAAAQAHLDGCPRSHTDVYELATVARLLAEAPEPVEPPARLRARILATAREDTAPQDAPSGIRYPVSGGGGPVPGTARAPAPARSSLPRRPVFFLLAAAAALAALALGLWNLQLRGELDQRQERLAAQQRFIDAFAGGGRSVAFAPAPGQEALHGAVVRRAQGPALAVFTALPRPAGSDVYQLWAIRGSTPQDLGVFVPDARGHHIATLPDLTGVDAVAVTLERERVPAPTTAPILTAPL